MYGCNIASHFTFCNAGQKALAPSRIKPGGSLFLEGSYQIIRFGSPVLEMARAIHALA